MKKLLCFSGALLTILYGSSAFACECSRVEDRDESYRTAKYVFWGEAYTDDDGDLRLRVLTNYKGTRRKRTHPVADPQDCGFRFQDGKKYMVFADKGEKKRELVVGQCDATTELTHEPLTPFVWTLAEELAYNTPRRAAARHHSERTRLTDRAVRKIKWSIGKCDDSWKEAKLTAKIEVRFDIQPEGDYEHELLTYEMPEEPSAEVMECLEKRLAEDDFGAFHGGPISVSAYWLVDRLDRSFGQDKASAVVVPFGGER